MKILKSLAVYTGIAVFWLLLWLIPSHIVSNEVILPTPLIVFQRLFHLAGTGDFWKSLSLSFLRVTVGVVSAIILAVFSAAGAARFKFVRKLLYPFNEIIKATPIVSFIFLAYIIFSKRIGLLPVFIVLLIVFPVVYGALLDALLSVDRELVEVSEVFGCTRIEKLRYLWIPTATNAFVSSCGTSLGLGWKAGIAAEALAATPALFGVGTEIAEAKTYIETSDQFALTLAIIIFSIIISIVFTYTMKKIKERIA